MKHSKYLNGVLTIIAFCLVIITLVITGLIPTAKGEPLKNTTNRFVQVPVNPDGSINVKLNAKDVIDVNIESCSSSAFTYAEPIEVRIKE